MEEAEARYNEELRQMSINEKELKMSVDEM